MSLPGFDEAGLLPPIWPGNAGGSDDRSPYQTSFLALCKRLGHTPARLELLRGLATLREQLRCAGLVEGFQWIDGSFVEDVERAGERVPQDIDVVTFAPLGDGQAQEVLMALWPELFDEVHVKSVLGVEHFFVNMTGPINAAFVRRVAYWYSMWSHQRDTSRWKGFVELPLSGDDADALAWLSGADSAPADVEGV